MSPVRAQRPYAKSISSWDISILKHFKGKGAHLVFLAFVSKTEHPSGTLLTALNGAPDVAILEDKGG